MSIKRKSELEFLTKSKFIFSMLLILFFLSVANATDNWRIALQNTVLEADSMWDSWRDQDYWNARNNGVFDSLEAADSTLQVVGIDENDEWIIFYLYNVNAATTIKTNEIQYGGITGFDLDGSTTTGLYCWDVPIKKMKNCI